MVVQQLSFTGLKSAGGRICFLEIASIAPQSCKRRQLQQTAAKDSCCVMLGLCDHQAGGL
jgi:hypothetical protein